MSRERDMSSREAGKLDIEPRSVGCAAGGAPAIEQFIHVFPEVYADIVAMVSTPATVVLEISEIAAHCAPRKTGDGEGLQ
ncbi:hypothetical protein Maq22A_c02075 [Methylobacterium aquaticum]|uniref:Uncharacterized protein n=1 Tax=Methylobacterium aquaticum TaxID=270351 RepID=A0A0C6FAS6_9HYPH|nr:hypothetical protein Maq22A_c02075 [Methylobacterium aquaticum]